MPLTSIYDDPNRLLRAKELQTHFGVSGIATIWRWVKKGKLPKPQYLNGQRVWRASVIKDAEDQLLKDESAQSWRGGL